MCLFTALTKEKKLETDFETFERCHHSVDTFIIEAG